MRLSFELLFFLLMIIVIIMSLLVHFSSLATINQTYNCIELYIFCYLPFRIYLHFELP